MPSSDRAGECQRAKGKSRRHDRSLSGCCIARGAIGRPFNKDAESERGAGGTLCQRARFYAPGLTATGLIQIWLRGGPRSGAIERLLERWHDVNGLTVAQVAKLLDREGIAYPYEPTPDVADLVIVAPLIEEKRAELEEEGTRHRNLLIKHGYSEYDLDEDDFDLEDDDED